MNDDEPELLPYEPPTVEDIPLRPEETVLAGCKHGASSPGSSFRNHICALCVSNAKS